jgi:hypothetical protein
MGRVFMAVLAAYFFVMTIVFSFLITDLFIPAVVPMKLEMLTGKIKPTEALKYLAVFKRNKPCRTEVQRFIVYKDKAAAIEKLEQHGIEGSVVQDGNETEFIGYRDTIIGIITQGASDIVRTVSVMEHPALPAGHYGLRIYVISACNLITRMDPYPEASFEVVE